MSGLAPIALFAYRRPHHLRATLDALLRNPEAALSDLWIFSDAARDSDVASDVAQVRALAAQVSGFQSVQVIERSENFGLARSIVDGVASLCAQRGRVIVVEDDLTVSPGFLAFMNRALERYADDEQVMQISGYQFPGRFHAQHAVLLPLISCWGWATWARAWRHYDPSATGAERLRTDPALRRRFDLDGAYDYSGMLESQLAGKLDSWGVRWLLSVFLHDGLVLYPPVTLVENRGADGSGTHGAGVSELRGSLSASAPGDFALPDAIEVDAEALQEVRRVLRSLRPGPLARLIRRLVA
jgi:hypothetical protein